MTFTDELRLQVILTFHAKLFSRKDNFLSQGQAFGITSGNSPTQLTNVRLLYSYLKSRSGVKKPDESFENSEVLDLGIKWTLKNTSVKTYIQETNVRMPLEMLWNVPLKELIFDRNRWRFTRDIQRNFAKLYIDRHMLQINSPGKKMNF